MRTDEQLCSKAGIARQRWAPLPGFWSWEKVCSSFWKNADFEIAYLCLAYCDPLSTSQLAASRHPSDERKTFSTCSGIRFEVKNKVYNSDWIGWPAQLTVHNAHPPIAFCIALSTPPHSGLNQGVRPSYDNFQISPRTLCTISTDCFAETPLTVSFDHILCTFWSINMRRFTHQMTNH